MKKCPFCAEEIQDEAIRCKHCGENFDGSKSTSRVVEDDRFENFSNFIQQIIKITMLF